MEHVDGLHVRPEDSVPRADEDDFEKYPASQDEGGLDELDEELAEEFPASDPLPMP